MDRIFRLPHKITLLLQKTNIGEETTISTQKCTFPTNGIIKSLKTICSIYVFAPGPRGRHSGPEMTFAVKMTKFPSKSQFGQKIHFCTETRSGGLGGEMLPNMKPEIDFTVGHSKGGS